MPDENTITAEIRQEKGRLRLEAYTCIRRSSALREAVEQAGGLGVYVEDWLELLTSYARRLTFQNGSPADILQRISLDVDDRSLFGLNDFRTLYHPVNPDVDFDQKVKIVDLSNAKLVKMTAVEAKAFVDKWKGAPLEIETGIDGKWKICLSSINPQHPFWSSAKTGRNDPDRKAALADLEKVLAGATRIEDIAPKHTGVNRTIRFYTPVLWSEKITTLRLVVHEMTGKNAEIEGVELYDVIKENRAAARVMATSAASGAKQRSASLTEITIREMLSGVKDSKGQIYFQPGAIGSPNRFDKFSLDYIGSGEGAQIHGWGLYALRATLDNIQERLNHADDRYRASLGGGHAPVYQDGSAIDRGVLSENEKNAHNAALQMGLRHALIGFRADVIEAEKDGRESNPRYYDRVNEGFAFLEKLKVGGQLFEVEIPDDDVLLHEDLPFAKQPSQVKVALEKLFKENKNPVLERGGKAYLHLHKLDSGYKVYREISNVLGSEKKASNLLNRYGIKGIAYNGGIDGPSAVLFDPDTIQIIRTYYQFAGEESQQSSVLRGKLLEAQTLAASGTDNEAVRQRTGWFRGMDGKWRYEIPDNRFAVNFALFSERPGARIFLPDIYDNPALYAAYPFLREIAVRDMDDSEKLSSGHGGTWRASEGEGTVILDRLHANPDLVLLHEIQHAIQRKEGFAQGASPRALTGYSSLKSPIYEWDKLYEKRKYNREYNMAYNEYAKYTYEEMPQELEAREAWTERRLSVLQRRYSKDAIEYVRKLEFWERERERARWAAEWEGIKAYERLAGEIEAEDTKERGKLTAEERVVTAPNLRSDAVVMFGDAEVASVTLSKRKRFTVTPVAEVTGEEIYTKDDPIPDNVILREKLIDWLEKRGWLKNYSNDDTGWNNIHVSKSSVRDIIYHGSGRGKVQAVAALPELIKNGIYLETGTLDNGLKRHIFAAKLNINNSNSLFAVGFVVQEDRQGRKYYEHEMTEIENLDPTGVPAQEQGLTRASRDSVMNIVRKHLGVKPDLTLDHRRDKNILGSTTIYPEKYLITLFENANLSTLLHETGHVFFEELERAVRLGIADEALAQDYQTLRSWLNVRPGQPLDRMQREKLARGFEAYLMEGKAPYNALAGAFARFSQWLKAVYKTALNL
ncbi:MAG: hypothetical protein LBS77_03125, partial [Desulfovibrio sp.]|nr:hypothetical protein [Desulfovibrio sp.]